MIKHIVSVVVLHNFNGFEGEAPKFVEVEGKKFESEDGKTPKLDDKKQPIPFVEKKPEDKKLDDLSTMELEALAEKNPKVKELLDQRKKEADDKKQKEEDDLKKKGEWETLAKNEKTRADDLATQLGETKEQLAKYAKAIQSLVEQLLKGIPKEKQSLIPDKFSAREKLEYIIANAAALGAKVTGGGGLPPSDNTPNLSEEEQLVKDFNELTKKPNKTQAEQTKLFEMSTKLKKMREDRRNKK